MQLVELNLLKAQPPQTPGARLAQMFGAAVDIPIAGTGAGKPALAGDDQPCRIRVQRLGDQRLADLRSIGIGGVDKGHPLVDHPPQQSDRFAFVGWRTPHAAPGNAHRSKAEAADRRSAAERQRHRSIGGNGAGRHNCRLLGQDDLAIVQQVGLAVQRHDQTIDPFASQDRIELGALHCQLADRAVEVDIGDLP